MFRFERREFSLKSKQTQRQQDKALDVINLRKCAFYLEKRIDINGETC